MFVEPASAASVAGLLKLRRKKYLKTKQKARIVCILTGHGLKDPDRTIKTIKSPKVIKPNVKAVLEEIGY